RILSQFGDALQVEWFFWIGVGTGDGNVLFGAIGVVTRRCAQQELFFAISIEVDKLRRLVVGDGNCYMPLPRTWLILWVFKPPGLLTGKIDDEKVIPAVCVEIDHFVHK